ncbi:MAG: FAD-dependent oxidoreductase [Oscillospiraceae bacterium]|nr:FAD-dependent oxidoreductase [Oscillospiraceae bacterium]
MVTNKKNLKKLVAKMTDVMPRRLHVQPVKETDPEYYGLVDVLDDDMVELALAMKQRKPTFPEDLAKKLGWSESKVVDTMEEMSRIGILEYNWENPSKKKQYILPLFVPGAAELLNMRGWFVKEHPEVSDMFHEMTHQPLDGITQMIPPGGAGIGMHVIPVEKAIPAEQKGASIEYLSHWLKKYEGQIGVGICSCRRAQTVRGEGSGDVEDYWCMGVGEFAQYCAETGKDNKNITYEEAIEILQKAEDNGYVHQITNIDGENKIFAICNCAPGVCYALRTSQLYNTPNMSRSCYTAHVDKESCVACGKCVEVCPAGAAKLGQKLCTKDGPVKYPKQDLPDDLIWTKKRWNQDFRNTYQLNTYDSGTAPCKAACPAHIAVQGYIKMAAEGRYLEALKLIKQDNPFPAVCGSICNRHCEDVCTRGDVDRAVAIDEIKKFIAEQELKEENRYIPAPKPRRSTYEKYEQKIAVIGAGPAGLSCAYYLANMLYDVTVFDRNPAPGGMLTMGIPSFRLDRDVINAEIDVLREMGVEFKCGVEVGKDITIQQLRDEGYKGFFLAIGAQKSAPLNIPGEDLKGVFGGVEFLREVNLGKKPKVGKKCAVIGGGNVAMDVCRTAVRLGADETYIVYRRSEAELPADPEEVAEAMEEGVQFRYLNAPAEVVGTKGKVTGLKVEIMELGEPDEKGRRKPVGTGKFETIPVDSVISSIGQVVDWGSLDVGALKTNPKGIALADEKTRQTAQDDIFVGGDVYTGPKFAIDAIAAGREGAESLHRFVHEGQLLVRGRNLRHFDQLDKSNVVLPVDCFDRPARQQVAHDPKKAKTFQNDRITFTEEQVKAEASRCLGCGACEVDENRCIGCGLCTTKCEFDAIHLHRTHPDANKMRTAEQKFLYIGPYAVKRGVKIVKRAVVDTVKKLGD